MLSFLRPVRPKGGKALEASQFARHVAECTNTNHNPFTHIFTKALSLVFAAALAAGLVLSVALMLVAHASTTITVNTTADELISDGNCSLREAIQAVNTQAAVDACPAGSGADTIIVPAGTYFLSSGELGITANVTINGAGAATTIIDGAGLSRVFHIVGATVTISGVTIRNGSAGSGGGIFNSGTLTLTNSTVSGNSAAGGGGIFNNNTLTLTNSTVSGNSSSNFDAGGGIHNEGTLTLNGSTVSGNSAVAAGGIENFCHQPCSSLAPTSLTMINSTISGNSASCCAGGIRNADASLTINSSTISGNSTRGLLDQSGGIASLNGAPTLKNTIVANNSPGDCSGSISSAGHNLSSDSTCSFTASGDLQNTNPLLGPLANNGGPTETHALLPGSPAIDAGSSDCPPPATDQRGVARPQGAACDIGAFELVVAMPVTLTYTGATTSDFNDPATLSAHLVDSTGAPVSGATITFGLDGQSCTGTTNTSGDASCSITPNEAAGTYTVTATYAGDTSHQASSASANFTVTHEETTITYTGPTLVPQGQPATLSAVLNEDGTTPISGRIVTLTLGSQNCTGTTDASGTAKCTISSVSCPLGNNTVTASFAGDAFYKPASDSKQVLCFAFMASGSFVLGDQTASSALQSGATVTWWGAQWQNLNSLSGGSAPAAFKGFAALLSATPPTCGGTWTTKPGNSSGPPTSVPSYMAVIVSSTVTKSGSTISGNIVSIVIVKTNPGYANDPGHSGTGTVVAVLC